ncbi:MAG: prepilin-type N-terminal cleavage/methylation domain-containing protein, partial [Pontiellaceae bacterium]|nr:prepilin-type N-terminal cleavage/methylation domain-containing protein [Pontiellaceae bacterium]
MKRSTATSEKYRKRGFTFLELLVAAVILTIVMSVAVQALDQTLRAWKRGGEVIDSIQHGDYVISQLVCAINSTLYFYDENATYAFTVEKDTNFGNPADIVSFVTTSSAFLPPDSPFLKGPHRIELTIDSDDNGDPALFVLAMPAVNMLMEDDTEDFRDQYDAEPVIACPSVNGLEILFWNEEDEEWEEEWEEENSVPQRIQVIVSVMSSDPDEDDTIFQRIIEIPVYGATLQQIPGPTSSDDAGGGFGGGGFGGGGMGGGGFGGGGMGGGGQGGMGGGQGGMGG